MKSNIRSFIERYLSALQKHLNQGLRSSLQPALGLGCEAVTLKLETLDVARIHEQSLVALMLPGGASGTRAAMEKRAGIFFAEANTPIEDSHRGARQTQVLLRRLEETLGQRTRELAASHRQLQRSVVRRKALEAVAVTSGQQHKKCLEESLELQKRLRKLTHRVLAAQEDERKSISHALQDEIAQTLLGINVGLLSLKQQARNNTQGLREKIANTQRMVEQSVQTVRRVAGELGGL